MAAACVFGISDANLGPTLTKNLLNWFDTSSGLEKVLPSSSLNLFWTVCRFPRPRMLLIVFHVCFIIVLTMAMGGDVMFTT